MKRCKTTKYCFLFLVLFIFSVSMNKIMAQETDNILDIISTYISEGDSDALSKYFDNMIELNILRNEGTYSKTQSKYILDEFFKKHPPKNFIIKHKGTSDKGAHYAIGTYFSEGKQYRTYFLMKKSKNQYLLQIFHVGLNE